MSLLRLGSFQRPGGQEDHREQGAMREIKTESEIDAASKRSTLYVEVQCVACKQLLVEKVDFSPLWDDYDFWCPCGKGMMGVVRWLVKDEGTE